MGDLCWYIVQKSVCISSTFPNRDFLERFRSIAIANNSMISLKIFLSHFGFRNSFLFHFWEFNKIIFSSNFTISHWANFQVDAQSSAYDWLMLFRHYFYQLWAPPSKHLFENPFSKVLWMYLILDPYRWLLEWITRYADGICYLFLRFLEKIPRLYRKWKWHIFATSCNIIMVKGLKLTKTR